MSSITATTSAAAAAATTDDDDDDDDVTRERLSLNISPRPNNNGELVRAVGSSVVITCQRESVDGDLAAEATTIEWLDKNDITIPSQTSQR